MKRIDGSLIFLLVLAIGGATLCFLLKGPDAFQAAAWNELGLLARVLPVMAGALLLGGFLQALIPQAVVKRWLGEGSGLRGILIATLAGACVPGGPTTSFPLVLTLVTAGADAGVVIAFITSWAVLGLNRVIVWELPFMGTEFAALRYLVSLPMPIIAGLLARRVPITIRPPVRGSD
jgi:uncharacterized membrane protein YraQ (UPF0718 family)